MADVADGKAKTVRIGSMVGDGIGHEIVPATMRVVDAAVQATHGPHVDWVMLPLGRDAIESHGSPIPASTLAELDTLNGWVLGPHDSASYPEEFRQQLTPGGTVRKTFGLFANIRPAAALPGVVAAQTPLPVLGVPMETRVMGGMDSLLSMAQMPGGIPVGTLAIGKAGAKNAALLAAAILALSDEGVAGRLDAFRNKQNQAIAEVPAK